MEREQIEKAGRDYALDQLEIVGLPGRAEAMKAFVAGADWRINSVWHDREEPPEVGRWFIFKADDTNPFKKPTIKKIAYYTNRIENDEGLDWLKMVAEYKILCWAYVDDLLETK